MEKWLGLSLIGVSVFGISYHYSKRFLDWMIFQSLGTRDYIVEKLGLMFIEVDPSHVLMGQFILSFGMGLLVFIGILPQVFPAMVVGALVTMVGWKLPKPIVDALIQRRTHKFLLQMVDGLALVANALKSGPSINQALGLVVQEMEDPIKQELNLVLNENKLGVSLEEAFNNLAKRIESDDVQMFVTSINVLKETGGNLAETFETIVTTMRERIKVEAKISAAVFRGKIQGLILLFVPPVLGGIFYLEDPVVMGKLFTTTIGWLVLLGVLLLEFMAFFLIMRIVKIEV